MTKSKLKFKILKNFVLVGLVSMLGIIALLMGVVLPSYEEIELNRVEEDKTRIQQAINRDFEAITSLVKDWAIWDDAYEFVQDSSIEFIESNFSQDALVNAGVDGIVFFDSNKTLFFDIFLEEKLGKYNFKTPDAFFVKKGWVHNPENTRGVNGYFKQDSNLWMYSSYPIVRSEGTSDFKGHLLMFKEVDADYINKISDRTQIKIYLSEDLTSPIKENSINDEEALGEFFLKNAKSEPFLRLQIKNNPKILTQGKSTLQFVLIYLIGFLVLGFMFLIHFFQSAVINPISEFKTLADKVQSTNQLGERIHIYSNDEIGELADSFNNMMSSLESSRAKLNELASKDDLTGLFNRRAILYYLDEEIKRSERYGFQVSLLMFDLDHFKEINDEHGHPEGDEVLREIARMAEDVFRESDIVGRLGGDEFMVIFPHTPLAGAIKGAERMRSAVHSYFKLKNAKYEVTLTGGVVNALECKSAQELIQMVDDRMYKAKHLGRNKIISS